MENENLQLSPLDAIERAQIDTQVATAHKYPRTISKVKADMLSVATMDEETASSCFYTLPRGGKTIQGPSVRMAEIAVACYGNLRAGSRIVSEVTSGDNPHVIVQSVAHDLEKNTAISIEKRRAITAKKDRRTGERLSIAPDDINLAVNACSSIAFRDAVFKVIPRAIINPVWEAAKRVAVGDVSSLAVKRSKVIDRLKQMGATEDRILAAVDARKVEDIGLDKLEALIGLGTSLKDGELTLEQAFPMPVEVPRATFMPPAAAPTPPPPEVVTTGGLVQPTPARRGPGRPRKQAEPQPAPDTAQPAQSKDEDDIPFDALPEEDIKPEPDNALARLLEFLLLNNFTFSDLQEWGKETGLIENADSISTLDELPLAEAERLLRNKAGLKQNLNAFLSFRKA